jgi:2-polyprenyl-3-methyl-5-hydroxy-6-metoxy-1,4-benzoquinol methylase
VITVELLFIPLTCVCAIIKMKVKEHYDQHLGNLYAWMVGDFDEKEKEQKDFFIENGLSPQSNKVAFDLGAGHGLQAVALASLGYTVKAVDFNKQLLEELALRRKNLSIEIVEDDILRFLKGTPYQAETIVCMGDTLSHLESLQDVSDLIGEASAHLEPEGKIVFSFRDLTTELMDEQRFIAVKSDDSRILTCFLEYFPDRVKVHDILYEKQNGNWTQKVSAYTKLRFNEAIIIKLLQERNFELIKSEITNRMIYLIGCKK